MAELSQYAVPIISTYRLRGAAAYEEEPYLTGATPISLSYDHLLVTRSSHSYLSSYWYKYFGIILFTLILFCLYPSPSLSNHSSPPNSPSPPWMIFVFFFHHFLLISSDIDCVRMCCSNLQCSRCFILPLMNAMSPTQCDWVYIRQWSKIRRKEKEKSTG